MFEHLDHREKNGYVRIELSVHMKERDVPGVTYHAAADNVAFLGDARLEVMAEQIRRCSGPSGSNRDYVLDLASALRELGVDDPHVFALERLLT